MKTSMNVVTALLVVFCLSAVPLAGAVTMQQAEAVIRRQLNIQPEEMQQLVNRLRQRLQQTEQQSFQYDEDGLRAALRLCLRYRLSTADVAEVLTAGNKLQQSMAALGMSRKEIRRTVYMHLASEMEHTGTKGKLGSRFMHKVIARVTTRLRTRFHRHNQPGERHAYKNDYYGERRDTGSKGSDKKGHGR